MKVLQYQPNKEYYYSKLLDKIGIRDGIDVISLNTKAKYGNIYDGSLELVTDINKIKEYINKINNIHARKMSKTGDQ